MFVRIARLGMRGSACVAGFFEGLVDVGDGQFQPAHRAVADEALPVAHFALAGIDRFRGLRRRAGGRVALRAEPAALDQRTRSGRRCRPSPARYGSAADDIDLRRGRGSARDAAHLGADQLVDRFDDALFRNAHQHDRLLVLDKLEAGEHALRIDADE